jgi:hypothetical protein
MSEIKRDLNVPNRDLSRDLAICNAATPGPWECKKNAHPEFNGQPWGWIQAGGRQIATWSGSRNQNHAADNRFIVEARTGWPHAIERALAAEAEVARLRLIFGHPAVYRALKYWTDELDLGSPDDWEAVYSARVAALKMAKEAAE